MGSDEKEPASWVVREVEVERLVRYSTALRAQASAQPHSSSVQPVDQSELRLGAHGHRYVGARRACEGCWEGVGGGMDWSRKEGSGAAWG